MSINNPNIITNGDMSSSITSASTSPAQKNFSISLDWTGTAIGTFSFEVSNDNTNWSTIRLTGPITANGVADNAYVELVAAASYVRVIYTAVSGTGTLQAQLVSEVNTDENVKVTDADARADKLSSKLTAGTGISLTTVAGTLGETLRIDNTNAANQVISVFGRTGVVEAESGDYASDQVSYDNSVSGLTATEVQAAIDEVEARVVTAESTITDLGNDKADKTTTITAGAGLSGGGDLSTSRTVDVNVDNSSIAIVTDTLQIKDDGVTTSKILNSNVTTPKIADNAVTAAKLDGSVAGAGLVLDGGDNSINVNVDNSTLEIDTDQVRIADDGVVTAKIADEAVTSNKLADGSVITAKIADANVTTAKITDANVTNAKLASDIDASKLASGTVADARLSANVDLLDTAQTLTGEKSFDKVVLNTGTDINDNNSTTLAEPDKSIVQLTGAPVELNIQTITATSITTGRVIQLQNDTAETFLVADSAGNIVTGTGETLSLAPKAVIILRYDGTNWRVIGGSGSGAGGLATEFYTHSTLPATLTPDIRYVVDISGGDAAANMPATSTDNDGSVIEVWPVNNPGGGEVVLTAAASHNFNDPDLGTGTGYVLDVSSVEFVLRDTGDLYEVRDAYWAAGFELQEASASQSGIVTTGTQTFAGDKTFAGNVDAASYTGLPVASVSASGIVTTGTQEFNGNKTFDDNVTVQGTLSASTYSGLPAAGASTPGVLTAASYSAAGLSITNTSASDFDIKLERVGKIVSAEIVFSMTANGGGATSVIGALPAGFRPSTGTVQVNIHMVNNLKGQVIGFMYVLSNGNITIYPELSDTSWSNGETAQSGYNQRALSFTYIV